MSNLKAGIAAIDITPQPGIPLTGFIARQGVSLGVHDPLFAKVLVLQAGSLRAAVITCDLLALEAGFTGRVRKAISKTTGIPDSAILIACTHTHSGPATIYLRECGEVDTIYLKQLQTWLVEAAQQAADSLRPATMGIGLGKVEKGVINRRQPGTAIDADLSVIAFQDEAGQPIATLVNYACHPVCLDHNNRLISADYPGVLTRILKKQTGAIGLFLTGAAGDINPECMGDFVYAEDLGGRLAAEVLKIMASMQYCNTAFLCVASRMIDLPLNLPPASSELIRQITEYRQMIMAAEDDGNTVNQKINSAMLGWAESTLDTTQLGNLPSSVSVELQMIRLGSVILAGIPGELFSGLGKKLKEQLQPYFSMIIGYANNDIGYIPTQEAYDSGGYEIVEAFKYYGYPAALTSETGDLLLTVLIDLSESMDTCISTQPILKTGEYE